MTTDLFLAKTTEVLCMIELLVANNMPLAGLKELTEETIPQWAGPTVTPLGLIGSRNKHISAKFDLVFPHPILLSTHLNIFRILRGAVNSSF